MENRRKFLKTSALGIGGLAFLDALRPVSADEAKLDPKLVRLDSGIEPLVRLLEDTPRERLLEEIGARIRKDLSYRELLAALLLAGVRNIQPRPSVGFKFHAVLVINSAHLASLSAPESERWLPIFWALDHFKVSQAATARESGWRMGPVDESKIPPAHKARQAFSEAMDNWDEAAADATIAGLARTAGADELFELFARYGARDFRDIGHKAIYVANSFRTLHCIGWQHAEPVLRSLAYALLKHEGDNPAKADAPADRPWRRNAEAARKIRAEWRDGKPDDAAAAEFLAALRTASDEETSELALKMLNRGVAPQSLWDALLCGSCELLMRQPGIRTLHSVTSGNALRYAFERSGNDETRRLLLLQTAAFVPLFRGSMKDSGARIDKLEPLPLQTAGATAEIFDEVSRDRLAAARKTLSYLKDNAQPKELIDAARVLVFLKGADSHDYKFSSAVLEDYAHLSPGWRERFLAASMFYLRGSAGKDNGLVARTRAALKG